MISYELDQSIRELMVSNPIRVQSAISFLAAQETGNEPARSGIYKYEGGVKVGKREICIRVDGVQDDWSRYNIEPTKEEESVVAAIGAVATILKNEGPDGLDVFPLLHGGDPLRSMLDLDWDGNSNKRRSESFNM